MDIQFQILENEHRMFNNTNKKSYTKNKHIFIDDNNHTEKKTSMVLCYLTFTTHVDHSAAII